MTEAADLRRAKAGDREAAGRVLARHRGLVIRWCNEMIEPGLDLDDAIQEAHVAALAAIKGFKPGRGYQFPTYLKRCVRNRLWNWRRDRRQRPAAQEPTVAGALDAAPARPAPDNFVILPMLQNLSKRDRTVLVLRYGLAGGGPLTPVMVARKLGRSPAEVKRVEAEALADLRFLAGEGEDPAG